MASNINFGKRIGGPQGTAPKLVTPGDGQIPPELDTDPRRNINPKTQTPSGRTAALVRRRKSATAVA